jgi:hypothetical protein
VVLILFLHTLISFSLAMTFNIAKPSNFHMSASEYLINSKQMSSAEREQFLYTQLLLGNVPDDMREAKNFKFHQTLGDGKVYRVEIWLSKDYLSLGTNEDWLRVPLTFATAVKLAKKWDAYPPTTKLVRMIYKNAKVKLYALPEVPDDNTMRTNEVIALNHNRIEAVRKKMPYPATEDYWVAGHKKDYVLSKRLLEKNKREAIYGWFDQNGKMIQPLSIIHGETYTDYSHGFRLIHSQVMINGIQYHYRDVLRHPVLSSLLSDEGMMPRLPIFETSGI